MCIRDSADIFPDLAAIERQFHHLVRTVPGEGLIIRPSAEKALERVLGMGCWTPVQTTGEGGQWQARLLAEDGSRFEVLFDGIVQGEVDWPLTGDVYERQSRDRRRTSCSRRTRRGPGTGGSSWSTRDRP